MAHITEQLYDDNPYDVSFEATVLDVVNEDGKTAVVLNRTLFFPEGGGQVPDRGVIYVGDKTLNVTDVQIKAGIIYHYLDASDILVGDKVTGEIDFDYRFSNMQQHSAEHIFSGLAKRYYNCTNVGFHLSDNEVTFDYDVQLTPEEITRLETEVNKVVYENRKIRAYYPSENELLKLDYRSKKEIEGAVRLVEIDGIDLCACCAPHVKSTGEIGICKVVDYMNYKGGVRISILCGKRAFEHYREIDSITRDIGRSLSAKREDIVTEINRLNDVLSEAQDRCVDYEKRYLDLIRGILRDALSEMHISHNNNMSVLTEHIVKDRIIILRINNIDNKAARDTVNDLKEDYPDRLVGIVSKSDKGYSFILGSGNIDCKKIAEVMRDKMSAKCGGSADMIQGNMGRDIAESDVLLLSESVGVL